MPTEQITDEELKNYSTALSYNEGAHFVLADGILLSANDICSIIIEVQNLRSMLSRTTEYLASLADACGNDPDSTTTEQEGKVLRLSCVEIIDESRQLLYGEKENAD